MRGVADQRQPLGDERARGEQPERKGAARARSLSDRRDAGRSVSPARHEIRRRAARRCARPRARFRSTRSTQRFPVSGRIANGPAGRKCSSARPLCSRSCATVRHDGRLIVIPAVAGDAGLLADFRARAVGADQQPRGNCFAVGKLDVDRIRRVLEAGDRCRRADRRRALSPSRPAHRSDAGSRSCARTARPLPLRRRRSRKSAAPRRRAWSRSPPCRGSAARSPRPRPRPRSPRTAVARRPRSPRRAGPSIAQLQAPDRRPSPRTHRPAPGAARSPAPGRQSPPRRSTRSVLWCLVSPFGIPDSLRLPCKVGASIAG